MTEQNRTEAVIGFTSLPTENKLPLAGYWACFILVLLKFWTNRFFGCCCGGPKQRGVPPSKTTRFQIRVFPPAGSKRKKSGFAGLFPQLSISVVLSPSLTPTYGRRSLLLALLSFLHFRKVLE